MCMLLDLPFGALVFGFKVSVLDGVSNGLGKGRVASLAMISIVNLSARLLWCSGSQNILDRGEQVNAEHDFTSRKDEMRSVEVLLLRCGEGEAARTDAL